MILNCFNCQRGQSTVEYVVVVTVLLTTFMAAPSVTKQLQTVFANKSVSYAFAVAISDPPSSKADKTVEEVNDIIYNISYFLTNLEWPDGIEVKIPGYEGIKKFIKEIEKLFD